MAWIESHQNLRDHPKTIRLAELMGWGIDETIGKLHRFWWWCADYAQSGDLRKFNDSVIGGCVGLNAASSKLFIDAMVSCGGEFMSGFIDRKPYFRVHDWWDTFGKFLQGKYSHSPTVWKAIRKAYGKHKVSVHTKPNLPNHTIPTNQKETSEEKVQAHPDQETILAFEKIWDKYPKGLGRKKALQHFVKAVKKDGVDPCRIEKALNNYLAQIAKEKITERYIKHGSTWFNQWEDYEDKRILPAIVFPGMPKADNQQAKKLEAIKQLQEV